MAKKRNRITSEMSKTIAESSPLIKRIKSVPEEISAKSIIEVPLKNLQINPYQPRIDINIQSLNELISSIEQNGLMQPIVITPSFNDTESYIIVAGHRRYEAFKIMGKEKIQSIIMKNLNDKDLAVLSLTENLMRENLHPIENAIAIKNILDNSIVESQNKLAEYVGLSKGYVSKLINILKLPANIIKTIKDINYTDINILVLLNKLEDEKQMFEAFNYVKDLSRSEAERYIKTRYLSNEDKVKSIINIKNTNNKINVSIDIKKLSQEQLQIINEKIIQLNEEILTLSSNWSI